MSKKFVKRNIAIIVIMAMCISVSSATFSKAANTVSQQQETSSTYSDGWSSGGFFNASGYSTGAKYFRAGNIYVSLSSTNQGASGYYYVYLKNTSTGATTSRCPVLMNGTSTANFPNMPAGNYRMYMTKNEGNSYQSYRVVACGS